MSLSNTPDRGEKPESARDRYPHLAEVIDSFGKLDRKLAKMAEVDLRLTLAGTRLLARYDGPQAVQMLREEYPDLFVELDRLDKEYPLGPIEPARPLPASVPVEAPSIIFRGPAMSRSPSASDDPEAGG
jgi:hypothetical protein